MLQSMHDRAQGWIVWCIVAGLSFLFALFGISYYLTPNATEAGIKARVNGEPISVRAYRRAIDNQINTQGLDQVTDAVQNTVMTDLIQQALVVQIAEENGFVTSPNQVEDNIIQTPLFEDEGSFSQERFETILKGLGLTTIDLKKEIGSYLTSLQFQQGLSQSQMVPTYTLDSYIQMVLQKRSIAYVLIPFDDFPAQDFSDEDLKSYYEAHHAQFVAPDQLEVDYVILSQQDLLSAEPARSLEDAQKLFQEQAEQLAELAFENPESLQPIVAALHLELKSSSKFTQESSVNTGIFKRPEVIKAAWSEAAFNQDNSSLITLSDTEVMILRHKAFHPAHSLSFDEARSQVRQVLELNAKKQQAEQVLLSLQKKIDQPDEFFAELKAHDWSWQTQKELTRSDTTLPPLLQRATWAFSDSGNKPWASVASEQGLFLVQLLEVIEPSEDEIKKDRGHFESGLKGLETQIFLLTLIQQKLKHADIQIYP